MITGVLGFIAPGTQGQVVAGLVISFLMLLGYQHAQPYAEKAYRHIGYAAAIELVLFFALGLMLKADIQVVPAHNHEFFASALGVLVCCVFVVPALIIARRIIAGGSLFEEETEEMEGAEAETSSKHGEEGREEYTTPRAAAVVSAAAAAPVDPVDAEKEREREGERD